MCYAKQYQMLLQDFISTLPEDTADTVGKGFEYIMSSDFGDKAINKGHSASDFTLPNAKGEKTSLAKLLEDGPIVLSFYRGGWCPFCSLEFKALHDILPQIKELGASLVGISPELPDNSLDTIEKHQLQFEVLTDVGNTIARQYGLVMDVPEIMRPVYSQWGIDLPALNGDDSWELPIPATFVIGRDSKIISAYINKNYTERMEPVDIIKALQTLKQY